MRSLSVKSDRNYQVIVGVNGLESIKELCKDHSKVLLIAPSSLIKLFKLKDGKNLTIFPTPDGENQKTVATPQLSANATSMLRRRYSPNRQEV